jgi:hypothetical protein
MPKLAISCSTGGEEPAGKRDHVGTTQLANVYYGQLPAHMAGVQHLR